MARWASTMDAGGHPPGVLPPEVVLTFGCATDEPATRLLRVDAGGDRLVETDARGETVRVVNVGDVVSFEARAKDDDEDRWDFADEYAKWLDEDDVREWRSTVVVAVASSSGKRDEDEEEDGSANVHVEYRLRAENDARALGHAMRRLSRGKWNPALDDTDDENLPASLDGRILRSGVVLRRRGRVGVSAREHAVRGGGGWSKRLAVVTAGGRVFLLEQCDARETHAVVVYGASVRVTDALSLDERSIIMVRKGAADGEFDVVAADGSVRLALAALDSDPGGAAGWIDALKASVGIGEMKGGDGFADENAGASSLAPRRRRGLDAETRVALANATRMALALRRPPPRAGSNIAANDDEKSDKDVLVLDRYWCSVELGVTAHFLFSFTVDAVRGRGATTTSSTVLLRVDTERAVIEGYAARRCEKTGEPRQTLVRTLDATDADVDADIYADVASTTPPAEKPRDGRTLRLVSRGVSTDLPGTELGRFVFQSAADRAVFQSLLRDVQSGAYQSADRYHARTVLKRGPEDGGQVGTSKMHGQRRRRPRYLVLVPGRLLVMASSSDPTPIAALSLADHTDAGAAVNEGVNEGDPPATLEVSVGSRRFVFGMRSVEAAREWRNAIADAMRTGPDPTAPPSPAERVPPVPSAVPSPSLGQRREEETAESEGRLRAEAEAREARARAKAAEEETYAKAREKAREAEAREAEAREAKAREAEARAKAESEARVKAANEARLKAEADAAEAFAKAERRASIRLEEERRAEDIQRDLDAAEARIMAEERVMMRKRELAERAAEVERAELSAIAKADERYRAIIRSELRADAKAKAERQRRERDAIRGVDARERERIRTEIASNIERAKLDDADRARAEESERLRARIQEEDAEYASRRAASTRNERPSSSAEADEIARIKAEAESREIAARAAAEAERAAAAARAAAAEEARAAAEAAAREATRARDDAEARARTEADARARVEEMWRREMEETKRRLREEVEADVLARIQAESAVKAARGGIDDARVHERMLEVVRAEIEARTRAEYEAKEAARLREEAEVRARAEADARAAAEAEVRSMRAASSAATTPAMTPRASSFSAQDGTDSIRRKIREEVEADVVTRLRVESASTAATPGRAARERLEARIKGKVRQMLRVEDKPRAMLGLVNEVDVVSSSWYTDRSLCRESLRQCLQPAPSLYLRRRSTSPEEKVAFGEPRQATPSL